MQFEWDKIKDRINRQKHRVSFLEACYIFADRYLLTMFDEEHSYAEDRWITIGQTLNDKILVVVHTYRKFRDKESIRIISARTATRSEERQYFERRAARI